MKTSTPPKTRQNISLGEFLAIVDSCSRDRNERLATIHDLFASGRVQVKSQRGLRRIRLSID